MSRKIKLFLIPFLLVCFFTAGMLAGIEFYKDGTVTRYKTELEILIKPILEQIDNSKSPSLPVTGNIHSNNYDFYRTEIKLPTHHRYGALEPFEKNLLYIDGQGGLFSINSEKKITKITTLKLPINRADYKKKYGTLDIDTYGFSIKDMLINTKNNVNTIFLSAIEFNAEESCFSLSVFSSNFTKINENFSFSEFSRIFKSQPCLGPHHQTGFSGTSSGGKLEHDGEFIYLSVGDFYFDGVNEENILQSKDTDYGKILKIDPINLDYYAIAQGLRNPQGIALTEIGLFETEHGPRGGDEFNLIQLDKFLDYGWPNATYGTNYGQSYWPLDSENLNHDIYEFKNPLHFWIPSIGISDLAYVEKNKNLKLWSGNFLISSLRAMSIFRMKLDNEQHVIGMEKIEMGFRIRDIEIFNGNIYALEDSTDVTIHIMEQR